TPGSGASPFSPLEHASWHGFTPTDLVFPTFLFVVGNAMAFAMKKFTNMSNGQVIWKILKRTLIIFTLGYLMYWFPFFRQTASGAWELSPFSHTRIPGVLQRIGVCYGIAAMMIYFLPKKMVWVLSIIFLLGYWLVMYLGGDYTMTGNIGLQIDKWLLGDNHLYHGEGIAFDPEGVLSTIPSVVNVIIGYYAGVFIREKGNTYETVAKLMIAGAVMVAIAYFWHLEFPINKKLWTSSFVFYTCGLAMLILGILIYWIELAGKRNWTYFFEVFGKNPLFIYLLSEITVILLYTFTNDKGQSIYESVNLGFYQKIAPGSIGSLLFALSVMFFCWLVGWWMDRNKKYIRV
ncbi:MAG: acyltransferase family protein, partial [Chitinophagaceae bacterium]